MNTYILSYFIMDNWVRDETVHWNCDAKEYTQQGIGWFIIAKRL